MRHWPLSISAHPRHRPGNAQFVSTRELKHAQMRDTSVFIGMAQSKRASFQPQNDGRCRAGDPPGAIDAGPAGDGRDRAGSGRRAGCHASTGCLPWGNGPGKDGPLSPRSAGVPSPAKTLPPGWTRSHDVVATVQGDGNGLHVLVADEASAYSWRAVVTLGDPGVDTTQWIGQGCVTASGRYMVVVYAPREVTNMASEEGVLGRAAVVDLRTGSVRPARRRLLGGVLQPRLRHWGERRLDAGRLGRRHTGAACHDDP